VSFLAAASRCFTSATDQAWDYRPPAAGQSEALDWIIPAFGRIKAGAAGFQGGRCQFQVNLLDEERFL